MGEKTGITWTHHTFNAWWGCVKIAPECAKCYAERDSKRFGFKIWGEDAERRFFGDKHWNEPLKWNAAAEKAGERRRVFTNSMADVFEDREDLLAPRARLWNLIERTPHLDWLVLTKRIENAGEMLPYPVPKNIWLGITAGTDARLRKHGQILAAYRDMFPVLWVSAEPLLGPLELMDVDSEYGEAWRHIDWWVVGGESGPGHRPMDLNWARDIRHYCQLVKKAFFFKQIGGLRPKDNGDLLDGREWKEFPNAL
jgi:protein gp37